MNSEIKSGYKLPRQDGLPPSLRLPPPSIKVFQFPAQEGHAPELEAAYNYKQREWIRKVFGNKCQGGNIGMKHKCSNDLQIHHIEPQAWGYNHGRIEEEIDTESNGIPLCADAHVGARGTKDCIHPDQREAQLQFQQGKKDAYSKLQERRTMMAESGIVYWNDRWDSNIRGIVRVKLARWYEHGGEKFPPKHHR